MPRPIRAENAPKVSGTNNPYGDPFAEEAIARHEEIEAEIKTIMSQAMLRVKDKRGDQREILNEAKEKGMNRKALRAHIKERALLKKADEVRDKLDDESADHYDLLKHALGQMGDTPLGESALSRASATAGSA